MKTLLLALLEKTIAALLAGNWGQVKAWVESYMRSDLPGDQKRQLVFEQLRKLGVDSATWLLYAAIEIAYGRIKGAE